MMHWLHGSSESTGSPSPFGRVRQVGPEPSRDGNTWTRPPTFSRSFVLYFQAGKKKGVTDLTSTFSSRFLAAVRRRIPGRDGPIFWRKGACGAA